MADTSRFNKHRATFERVANGKHCRGEIAEGGAMVVNVPDLKVWPLTSAGALSSGSAS
jgi:hypothetical protein